jgi:hypothetical protein
MGEEVSPSLSPILFPVSRSMLTLLAFFPLTETQTTSESWQSRSNSPPLLLLCRQNIHQRRRLHPPSLPQLPIPLCNFPTTPTRKPFPIVLLPFLSVRRNSSAQSFTLLLLRLFFLYLHPITYCIVTFRSLSNPPTSMPLLCSLRKLPEPSLRRFISTRKFRGLGSRCSSIITVFSKCGRNLQ